MTQSHEDQVGQHAHPTCSTDLAHLHQLCFPLIQRSLSLQGSGDQVDYGTPLTPLSEGSVPGYDQVDAKGTFKLRDIEKELKENVGRQHLENELGKCDLGGSHSVFCSPGTGLSWTKIREVLKRADKNGDGKAQYGDFLLALQHYRIDSEECGPFKKMVRAFAYVEEFHTFPPPLFISIVTLMELGIFIYHAVHLPRAHGLPMTWEGPVPYCSVLIYNPFRRWEAWRFLTYMFVHIGIGHFVFNIIMQLIVGLPLEMQQEGWVGSLRVAMVYLCGVVAGSLGTSLVDAYTYMAGASGGVYALIAAHLSTLILNWKEDSSIRIKKVIHQPLTRIVRLLFIVLLTVHDLGLAIYVRYYAQEENRTGFMGHLCGAIAGFLVGVFVLDNRRVQRWEVIWQRIAWGIFLALIGAAILWNGVGNLCTNNSFFPPSDFRALDGDSGNCQLYL
ncbi:hypothetical protein TCAL_10009 [Tigriopus californicus]|uniref:EF-hand domain-containing protein n=1 Tax=Tigriopus californicus TaxID=6832 RepID=A0A553NZE6_TIGCA|nr:hypothetical protein TCAL_10009 [Tigriopus californicus]